MTMRTRHRDLTVTALASLLIVGSAIAPSAAVAEPIPGSGCRVFPASNIWNTRVDALPVHELSDTWLRSATAGSTSYILRILHISKISRAMRGPTIQ